MKIYTKNGDDGSTFVPGEGHVLKCGQVVFALGELDELNAWIGVLIQKYPNYIGYSNLTDVQDVLMRIGAQLAGSGDLVVEADVVALEVSIDELEGTLEPLKNFILPGFPAEGHVARAVCRRAERIVILWFSSASDVSKFSWIIPYLNRLSDFLFVWCRAVCKADYRSEKKWILK